MKLVGGAEERRVFFDLPPTPTCSYKIPFEIDAAQYQILTREFINDLTCEALKSIYGLGDAPLAFRYSLHVVIVDKRTIRGEQSRYCE